MSVAGRVGRFLQSLLLAMALIVPLQPAHAEPIAIDLRIQDESEFIKMLGQQLRVRLGATPEKYRLVTGAQTQVILTIGPKAFQQTLAEKSRLPLLAVGIARPTFVSALESNGMTPETARDICGIFVGQSPRHNLALVRALLPRATQLGVFSSPGLPVRPPFAVAAQELSLSIASETVSSPAQTLAVLDRLLVRSDALLVSQSPDSTNGSNIRQIVLASLYAGKPVIGGATDGFVEEGALAAIFSKREDLEQEALRRLEVFRGVHTLGTSGYSRDWSIRVNRAIATTLRLTLPKDEELRATIARLAGDE